MTNQLWLVGDKPLILIFMIVFFIMFDFFAMRNIGTFIRSFDSVNKYFISILLPTVNFCFFFFFFFVFGLVFVDNPFFLLLFCNRLSLCVVLVLVFWYIGINLE